MTVQIIMSMINDANVAISQLDELARKYKMEDADRGVITRAIELLEDYAAQLGRREVK